MSKPPIFSKQATTDIRKMIRRKLELEPNLAGTTRVEAEIVKNHLMKAKISLPALGVEFTIFADEPSMAGGEGSAPFMFGYFMAGTLLCEMAQYTWCAAELDMVDQIHSLKMSIEGEFPLAPLYGLDNAPGASSVKEMKVKTQIESNATPEQIKELARLAAARCPAHQSIVNKVPYSSTVELNGQQISTMRED